MEHIEVERRKLSDGSVVYNVCVDPLDMVRATTNRLVIAAPDEKTAYEILRALEQAIDMHVI